MHLALFLILSFLNFIPAINPINEGIWRGVVYYDETEVPFNFEISMNSDDVIVHLMNGPERIEIKNSRIEGDSIFIPMHLFHSEVRAKINGDYLEGTWIKYYRRSFSVPFKAEHGYDYRYKVNKIKKYSDFSGKWVTWILDEHGKRSGNYWITLIDQKENQVNATVLTDVGDFRYMEGVVSGDEIFFSSFDGAHAFVFNGKMKKGKWKGVGITDLGENTQFECEKDPKVDIPDAFEMVEIEEGKYKADFDFYDPAGNSITSTDPRYDGKVVIVQVFGTWCANSMDATNYLKEYYQKNKERGIEVVALAFETSSNPAYGYTRIKNMQNITEVEYPIAFAGSWSKVVAAQPFPVMDRIQAFPTLIIIDKEGYIRKVNSFFTGPATGEYYERFVTTFESTIEELLQE